MRYLLECDGHIVPDHSSNIRGYLWTHIRIHNIHLGVLFRCITASRLIAAVQNMQYSVEYWQRYATTIPMLLMDWVAMFVHWCTDLTLTIQEDELCRRGKYFGNTIYFRRE